MGHAQHPAVPTIYGRYQTLFRIASGGMAEVYAARVRGEAGFQKLVALKRMLPHLTDDERFVNMFMDEGKLAANIDSPNVVSTLDLGRAQDGSLYLVMELVVGTTLSTLLRNAAKDGQSCPIDVACEILAQAAQGLHDAHEAKTPFGAPLQLVHRDISPQNILVGVDGRVRITDFGVARAVLRRTKTSTGEFKGKLSYFSPEQCADKNLDRRSDLFSLGVVAWETLTTRRLFHAENPLAVLERVTRMEIPSAHQVRPEVPESVAAVVTKALERDRDLRFDTALEFGEALRAAARETVGTGERNRVTLLVQSYGGDQLDRVQAQLKESLANAGPALLDDDIVEEPDEASGIVMRPDDAPATTSSTSLPAFKPPPDAAPAEPKQRRAPLYVAIAVAALGLGGGATIGFMAGGTEEPTPDVQTAEASETDTPEADPETVVATTDDVEDDGTGTEDDSTPVVDDESPEDDTQVAEPTPRRRSAARRRAAQERQERARREAAALAEREAELNRRQQELDQRSADDAARRQQQREAAAQRRQREREEAARRQPPDRGGGTQNRGNSLLASPDDFMREVQR